MGILDKYNKAVATSGPNNTGNTGIIFNPNSPQKLPFNGDFDVDNFGTSSFDLTNPTPAGGPINAPQYNFSHTYLPQPGKRFEDKPEGQIRGPGNFAYDTPMSNKSIFHNTDLDLENPAILGGPINVPYNTQIGTEYKSFNTTQPYLPKLGKTYQDSFQDPRLIARATDPIK